MRRYKCISIWSRCGVPRTFSPWAQELLDAYEGGDPVTLATVVNVHQGATNLGAKLLLRHDGSVSGTLWVKTS